jgi:hypothetical protein
MDIGEGDGGRQRKNPPSFHWRGLFGQWIGKPDLPIFPYLAKTKAPKTMEKIQFTQAIAAPAQKVYETMLGLKDKSTYESWTAAFNPTSTFEGSWDKGSKIYFVGVDENGKKGGMISEIAENRPAEFVSIRHYGFLDGDTEITTGEQVEKWTGGHENYTYQEQDGITTVIVDLDTVSEYLDFFNDTYPAALEKLKELAEE